jgi:DNA-binding NtrC family response regulator
MGDGELTQAATEGVRPKVLIVDDDRDTAELMQAALTDEGYAASAIYHADGRSVREAVARLEPDCVLLDSAANDPTGYGESWQTAAWIAARERNVPVIMMTGHSRAADEAIAAISKRARAADFAAVIRKPFELDDFLLTLSRSVQRGVERRPSEAQRAALIAELIEQLIAAGARDISSSSRRVWATFRGNGDELMQIYRWERLSVYLLGRYSQDGARLEPLGQFTDLQAALAVALP